MQCTGKNVKVDKLLVQNLGTVPGKERGQYLCSTLGGSANDRDCSLLLK
jgi:hypothetical protein